MTVLVECYPDEALLRALGVPRKQVRHERCKGEVVKKVRKLDSTIGIVDQDPASTQPRDLANYEEVQAAEGLRLLARRGSGQQKLILVCPRLEEWLIERAKSLGIRTEDYGLPADPKHLHGIPRYDKKDGFRRFLDELVDRDSAMHLLRQWVFPE
ncbi:MAG: hypothetical protein ACYTAS_16475 [Planctomycetota bacterium]|jgi:hypothetical protein